MDFSVGFEEFDNSGYFDRFDTGMSIFMIIFIIMFVLILGVFIFIFVRSISKWNKNNNSPRLTVYATVISKRTDVRHRHHSSDTMHSHYWTYYYVAFQVESGDRMELEVDGNEYGILIEGDRGYLSFQGTRFLGFQRV